MKSLFNFGWVRQIAAGLLAGVGISGASAQMQPSLQLDPGAHWAPVRRLALSADDSLVVTASDDKTARVWDLATGQLVQTLRPPIGNGAEGRLYGVAIHPLNSRVVVGGTVGPAAQRQLLAYEPLTGQLLGSHDAGAGDIKRLAWTGDGKWLLAGMAASPGLAVFDEQLRRVNAFAFGGDCYGLDVHPDGLVAATDLSGRVRLFRAGAQGVEPWHDWPTPLATPTAVAIAPDGKRLAVVYREYEREGVLGVDILEAESGKLLQSLRAAARGYPSTQAVRWSADAARVVVAGFERAVDPLLGPGYLQEFDLPSGQALGRVVAAAETITDVVRTRDGRFVYSSADALWGVSRDQQPQPRAQRRSDWVHDAGHLWVDAAARTVQWRVPATSALWSFDLAGRVLRHELAAGVHAPARPGPFDAVLNWENSYQPTIRGRRFALAGPEASRAALKLPGTGDIVLGTTHQIARIGDASRPLWSIEPGSETRALNSSDDGALLVAALTDGTVRWYRATDGALLLSLYSLNNGQWVLWTPGGYYDASAGAESIIGWQLQRPGSAATEYFTIGRFRERYLRPDVIDRVLGLADEAAALLAANDARASAVVATAAAELPAPAPSPSPTPAAPAAKSLPPTLAYKQPAALQVQDGKVTLSFGVSLEPGEEVAALVVRRDGVIQNPVRTLLPSRFDGTASGNVTIDVPEGASTIHISVANRFGFSDALVYNVVRQSPRAAAPPAPPKPRLFVLAIGIGQYRDGAINALNLPAKDASDFAAVLGKQNGRVYDDVVTRVLTDRDASRQAIIDALRWLSNSVGEKDYGILFLAGHGYNHADGHYYFLSHDTQVSRIPATSVDEGQIRAALVRLKGRAIFFVDTCFSGNAVGTVSRDTSKIANELASPENGVIVFASSTGRQESQENLSWGNGAFTKALVAGLQGGADLMRRGRVTYQGLGYYVSSEVEKLTGGKQTPVMIVPPPGLQDFTLAFAGDGARPTGRFEPRPPTGAALAWWAAPQPLSGPLQ